MRKSKTASVNKTVSKPPRPATWNDYIRIIAENADPGWFDIPWDKHRARTGPFLEKENIMPLERFSLRDEEIYSKLLTQMAYSDGRVVESTVGISYSDDPQKAIDIVLETLKAAENVISEPSPQIGIHEFADSSINIGIRYWVPTRQYFQTLCKVNLEIFKNFHEAGIAIPFPQRDVHLIEAKAKSAGQ